MRAPACPERWPGAGTAPGVAGPWPRGLRTLDAGPPRPTPSSLQDPRPVPTSVGSLFPLLGRSVLGVRAGTDRAVRHSPRVTRRGWTPQAADGVDPREPRLYTHDKGPLRLTRDPSIFSVEKSVSRIPRRLSPGGPWCKEDRQGGVGGSQNADTAAVMPGPPSGCPFHSNRRGTPSPQLLWVVIDFEPPKVSALN